MVTFARANAGWYKISTCMMRLCSLYSRQWRAVAPE
jgi:hypothetical protein